MEGQERGLIVLGKALNQAFQRHISNTAQNEAVEVPAVNKLFARCHAVDRLIDNVLHAQHRRRRNADNIRQPQRALIAVHQLGERFQRGIVECQTEFRPVAVGRINAVLQSVNVRPVERYRLGGHSTGYGYLKPFRLNWCACAGTFNDVFGLTAPDTLSNAASQIRLDINPTILQQFVRNTDDFGTELLGPEDRGTELNILLRCGGVFAQQFPLFRRAVRC